MSAIDYTKAYITHNGGTSLATIDENNNFVDLGAFVDGDGNALTKVYGLAFGKDGPVVNWLQNLKDKEYHHNCRLLLKAG